MNNFGATYWTDGYVEGPMYAQVDWLLKQPITGELFWVDECEEVGRQGFDSAEDESESDREKIVINAADIPLAESPTESDFRAALEDPALVNTAEKERHLRTALWWIANDPIRKHEAQQPADFDFFQSNLSRLAVLLDTCNPEQRLMRAEVARELEDFAGADGLLRRDFPNELQPSAEFLRKLVRTRDPLVRAFAL